MSLESWEYWAFWVLVWSNGGLFVATIVLIVGLVGEYFDPDSSIMMRLGRRSFKKYPFLVIAGVSGELLFNGLIFGSSLTLEVLHSDEVARLKVIASTANAQAAEAFKTGSIARAIGNAAEVRADALAVELEDLKSKNLEQAKQIIDLEIRFGVRLAPLESRKIDFDALSETTRGLSRSLKFTIIRLNDSEPRSYANDLVASLSRLNFDAKPEDLNGSSPLTDVIVCGNDKGVIRVQQAFVKARIEAKFLAPSDKEWPSFCNRPPLNPLTSEEEGDARAFFRQVTLDPRIRIFIGQKRAK